MSATEKLCISVSEASDLLGLSKPIMYELCNSESCTFVIRVGRRLLISRAGLEAWIAKQAGGAAK